MPLPWDDPHRDILTDVRRWTSAAFAASTTELRPNSLTGIEVEANRTYSFGPPAPELVEAPRVGRPDRGDRARVKAARKAARRRGR